MGPGPRFLRRLEQELYGAGKPAFLLGQEPAVPQEDGYVAVMAAGMGHPRHRRGIGHAASILHGQGVDVRPQEGHPFIRPAGFPADDPHRPCG